MTGTIVNSGAIIAGSIIGIAVGQHMPERMRTIIMNALGLSVIVIGLQMALSGEDLIATVACVLLGAITGELLKIERGIEKLGESLKRRFRSRSSTFVEGFVSSSVLYVTGVLVILGPLQEGTTGDASILYIKSLLDGFASVVLASTLGIGVLFSALPVFIIQGAVTLLASSLLFLKEPLVLNAITSAGGVLIFGIGINLLEIKKIRIGNFIPAIIYAAAWALMH
ncbi:MAG: DUF554 domain-containing protein [Deltaproteobacteria bacterium]|nr:DUF554 domain-containing protein [Deltaproteobacteria bacterium]